MGKIAELTDKGIPVHVFRGNHDLWAFDYLENEIGVKLYRKPVQRTFGNKNFFLAHGDGLGPGDNGYKFIKSVFENKINQFFFNWLHPDIGTKMGLYFSRKSRIANIARDQKSDFRIDIENEMLYKYCLRKVEQQPEIDYFVFGHRHLPLEQKIGEKSKMVILGDWIIHFSYAVFDGQELKLAFFKD